MLTIEQILFTDFERLDHAADAWDDVARRLKALRDGYDVQVVRPVAPPLWTGAVAGSAQAQLGRARQQFDLGVNQAEALARAIRDAAASFRAAHKQLYELLDDAERRGFTVDHGGQVSWNAPTSASLTDLQVAQNEENRRQAQQIADAVGRAVRAATEADARAADDLTLDSGDNQQGFNPRATVGPGLGPQDPVSILTRLMALEGKGLNLPPELIAYARQMAAKYGVSEKLMFAILVQEQAWFQNLDPGMNSPLSEAARFGSWVYREFVDPTKSMGIVHMKVATAREAADKHGLVLSDGREVAGLSDAELAAAIEGDPRFAIELSAMHLADLRRPPESPVDLQGSKTDLNVFLLYAANVDQVRASNERYGDDPTMRENVIRTRMESWQGFEQHLADTRSWEALTPEQRAAAIAAVGGTLPYGAEPTIPTVYPLADGVQTSVPGSNSSLPWFPPPPGSVPVDPPGTPSPAPAPPPKAP